jgi:hypothetical protein
MSNVIPPTHEAARHPLGLPAGSIRAALSLMIAGLFWAMVLLPVDKYPVPLFLYFLTGLVFLFFFSHGKTIGGHDKPSPWGLPRGVFRFILVVGSIAAIGWSIYKHPDDPLQRLNLQPEQLAQWPRLMVALAGGFALGWLIGRGPWHHSYIFQDLLAWVSMIGMFGLVIETILVIFVNPGLKEEMRLANWEAVLTGIVAFYFGART